MRERTAATRRADAALVPLAAVLGGLFFLDSAATTEERAAGYPIADLAVGLIACAALLLRRRWPVPLAVALIGSFVISSAAMGATAVAVGAVAVYRSRLAAGAVLAAHAALVTSLFALVTEDPRVYWMAVAVVLAIDVAAVAVGLLVRSLRERAAETEERHRLRVEEARHAERERIAREMHDVLAHRISLLAVYAGALQVRRSATDEERRAAGVVRQCADDAMRDLRQVIGMLRDDGTDADHPQPTLADLPALVDQSRSAGMRVAYDHDDVAAVVPPGVGRHAYRVVQEALTNARKHAPDAPVRVSVRGTAGSGLTVEVTNPVPAGLRGTPPGAGSGLIGLRERVHLLDGRLEHGVTPDGAFRLYAWLPSSP
jgi:signal transduction histidine kinase